MWKKTTPKLINRLIEPTERTVRITGKDTRSLAGHRLRRRIGYCFQEVGLPTRTLQSLGSTVAFASLVNGDVDVLVDYSGTIWATIMQRLPLPEGINHSPWSTPLSNRSPCYTCC